MEAKYWDTMSLYDFDLVSAILDSWVQRTPEIQQFQFHTSLVLYQQTIWKSVLRYFYASLINKCIMWVSQLWYWPSFMSSFKYEKAKDFIFWIGFWDNWSSLSWGIAVIADVGTSFNLLSVKSNLSRFNSCLLKTGIRYWL